MSNSIFPVRLGCAIAFVLIACAAAAPVPGHPLLALRPGTWWVAPNSQLASSGVAPSPLNYTGLIISLRQMFADTGGALDPVRSLLFVTGAGVENPGSNDNSMYAFDVHNLNWTRYWGPGGVLASSNRSIVQLINQDASGPNTYPAARDLRDGIEYDPINDEIVTMGGEYYPQGATSRHIWTFNNKTWTRQMDWNVGGSSTYAGMYGLALSFDELSQSFVGCGQYDIHRYNPTTRNVSSFPLERCGSRNLGGIWNYGLVANVIPEQNVLHMVGRGKQYIIDINAGTVPCILNISSADEVFGSPGLILSLTPGVDKYPANKTLVGHAGTADAGVYVMNTTSKSWKYLPAAPENTVIPPTVPYNIFSRWRYVPDYDVFIYVLGPSLPVYFYKLGNFPLVDSCDPAARPQQPYPDAWDCVNGTWSYVGPLTISPQTTITITSNATIVGNLGLSGRLVVPSNVSLEVTGCIVIDNGSSIDILFEQISYEEAASLIGDNITIAVSSTKCIQNAGGLSDRSILISRGSTPCKEVSGTPFADQQRGSLSIVFVSSGAADCGPLNLSGSVPTWAIGVIVGVAVLLVVAIVVVLAVPQIRTRVIPSYRVKSQLRAFVRNSLRVEEEKAHTSQKQQQVA